MPTNKKKHTLARQWELLRRLPSRGPGKTATELTHELQEAGFEVSKRQVERDLGELMDAFDLDCNNASVPFGWRWLPGAGTDLAGLTLAEALSLSLVEDTVKPLLPISLLQGLESRFTQAKKKLDYLAAENPTARWIDKVRTVSPTQPLLPPQIDPEPLRIVQECLLADEIIDAEYRGMDSEIARPTRLHPLGLINRGQMTYLVATAWDYPDIRLYALHRIAMANRTNESAKKPQGFTMDAYIVSGALQFGHCEAMRFEARIDENLKRILSETPLAEDQCIQGNLLSATVRNTWQLEWWILGQGKSIEVITPKSLRQAIHAALADALSNYSKLD